MRISKDPIERRNEILDAAERLFMSKGFAKSTVNDILQEVGIAKGTFYYYFTSKEEVMDAIIVRMTEHYVSKAKEIADRKDMNANEKLFRILMPEPDDHKEQMIEQLHEVENAQMHQKSLVESILHMTPVMTGVLEQGIAEGLYHTPYPREAIEFILVTSQFLFDEGIFKWEEQELKQKAIAFIWLIETILGADQGSLAYIAQLINQDKDNQEREHE